MSDTIGYIIMTIICIVPIVLFYLMIRNHMVATFRYAIINLSYVWSVNSKLHTPNEWAFYWFYEKLPSHEKMMFSFKKLKLKNWATQEQLDKLLTDPKTKELAEELKLL